MLPSFVCRCWRLFLLLVVHVSCSWLLVVVVRLCLVDVGWCRQLNVSGLCGLMYVVVCCCCLCWWLFVVGWLVYIVIGCCDLLMLCLLLLVVVGFCVLNLCLCSMFINYSRCF